MGLDVKLTMIVIGGLKQHKISDSEPDKFSLVAYTNEGIIPDGFTLPHGFRHQFNYWDTECEDVHGLCLSLDQFEYHLEYRSLGLSEDEARVLYEEYKGLRDPWSFFGIITLDNYKKLAIKFDLEKIPIIDIIEAYLGWYNLKDQKVLILVEGDQP